MVKIVENKGQYKITIPIDIIKDKGWEAGTEVRFVEDEKGNIYLKVIQPKDTKDTKGEKQ